MTPTSTELLTRVQTWLSQHAFPFWLEKGVDRTHGGFFEALTLTGEPMPVPRRAMVQARQIYSFKTAMELGCCDRAQALAAIERGTEYLLKFYSQPGGSFSRSIHPDGTPFEPLADLYTQAFALFGLAHAYGLSRDPKLKTRAVELVQYLGRERRATGGGFTEINVMGTLYQSNPHMHLFEAAIAWMEIDPTPLWKILAEEIIDLCLSKFIESSTDLLCEHFEENWTPTRNLGNGDHFVVEPGHQYEWSWLMGRYEKLTGVALRTVRLNLFKQSETFGILREQNAACDELWSDLKPKLKTARFWPQCERIKAALQLALEEETPAAAEPFYTVADEALETLFKFLDVPIPGLWYDTWEESGEFKIQPAKSSSLYHIIGAMAEYLKLRTTHVQTPRP